MTAKTDQYQIGVNVTAANNFTLVTDGAGGMKISRGNPGATTADILTIAADNKITLLQPLAVASGGTGDAGSAWTVVAANFSPASGAFGDASGVIYWKRIGKTVFFNASLTITSNGTGGSAVNVTLPFVALQGAAMAGRADNVSGKTLNAVVKPGLSTLSIFTYDNAYPGANGEVLRISGVYETSAA